MATAHILDRRLIELLLFQKRHGEFIAKTIRLPFTGRGSGRAEERAAEYVTDQLELGLKLNL